MEVFQMPRFKKYVKKLPRPFQQVILDEVEDVLANPGVGELKKATWRALGFINLR
jgi:mRNA-degrading endonuclease RelE of RelBE toxin-antitoxin system